ncbi:MAG: hypothetical protein FJX74_17410, partial [Armatimonadetes bacterium]|nr:hypothetical protein [Armatimonadota bacterium]
MVYASAVSDYAELLAIDARRPETPSPSRRCSATGTLRPALRNAVPAAAAEVSIRDSCFDPGEQVPNFISIQGLTTKQASPNG